MKNNLLIFSLAMFMAATSQLHAQNKDPKDCAEQLVKAIKILDRVETYVPQVPPEEASYLEKEYNAAFKANANHRLGKVTQRPMYAAWDLHNNFATAKMDLEQNQKIQNGVSVKTRLLVAMDLPMSLADARVSWENYMNTLKEGDMTMEQIGDGTRDMTELSGMSGLYYGCLANLISEK